MHLSDPLSTHFRIDKVHHSALQRLGIKTVQDLLYHLPVRYEDINDVQSVASLQTGAEVVVYGRLSGLKSRRAWKSKRPIAEGVIEDGTAKIKVMWFNQPNLAKMYQDGSYVKVAGKVTGSGSKLYIANPEVEPLDTIPIDRQDSIFKDTQNIESSIYPIYRESKGVTSKWFYHTIMKCFEKKVLEKTLDPIPEEILQRYNLPTLTTALVWIHSPKKAEHAQSARKRFAFEEIFYIQIKRAQERAAVSAATTYQIDSPKQSVQNFIDRFPFSLTGAQERAITNIITDMQGTQAMSRLLEGDVGSGKTAVAATTTYAVATSRPPEGRGKKLEYGNLQVAYMAPTEILAKQHFESFIEYFHHLPIQIGLITGSGCMKFPSKTDPTQPTKISKTQLLKWVKNGDIPILIGTHALIYKSVEFKHLAYVIIDEQHRFGTTQRKKLTKKDERMPHLLSMTATPIPRTLALTMYGDLNITLLDEMPAGRKPVITTVIGPGQEEAMYNTVRTELNNGRQVYVICPRIDEPDPDQEQTIAMKNVTTEAERLQRDVFPEAKIATLHGKMSANEKEEVMRDYAEQKIDILVATSVVEVGVNVPNATTIIIEGAERFGLAQLHQLRGRVLRGTHQAYCFAVTESKSEKTRQRLKALSTAKNGFELAEYDLQFRGSGELYGAKQSGLSDLGMEALKNLKLVEVARTEAQSLVARHPDMKRDFPLINEKVTQLGSSLHLE